MKFMSLSFVLKQLAIKLATLTTCPCINCILDVCIYVGRGIMVKIIFEETNKHISRFRQMSYEESL